jgi:hypothetical protein
MTKVNPIERNDVDLNRLFKWKTKVEIVDENQEVLFPIYMRLVGDADLNRARIFAIRTSKDYRKLLRDSDSDEHIALLPEQEELTKGSIIDSIIIYSMQDFALDATKVPEPKELKSTATLEEQEEFQENVDQYPEQKEKAIENYVEKKIEEKRNELSTKNIDDLYTELIPKIIAQRCETKMLETFREYSIFLGTFQDKKYTVKFFKEFDEFLNLPTNIKDQFEVAYSNLELGIDELKN